MIDGEACLIELLDSEGQEEYAALRETWYRSGDGFMVMYDICSRESFEAVRMYVEELKKIKEKMGAVTMCCLLGNKNDLDLQRTVGVEDGKKLAEELGTLFQECSAKTGDNVEEVVGELVRAIRRQRDEEKVLEETKRKAEEKERIKVERRKSSLWRRILSR